MFWLLKKLFRFVWALLWFLIKTSVMLLLLFLLIVGGINFYMQISTEDQMLSRQEACALEDRQCILVLGGSVLSPTQPGMMVQARLDEAIALYEEGAAPKLLMSGDHRASDYNEVGTMKYYAISLGVPSEDVFLDHKGLSTYESMYRAKEVFGCKQIIVVTQPYHMARAIYIGKALGMDVVGVACETPFDEKQEWREAREIFARVKDFIACLPLQLQTPTPSSSAPISLDGNGDATNEPFD